jgi:arginyl-tRNA synthetase
VAKDKYRSVFSEAVSRAFRMVYREKYEEVGNRDVFNCDDVYQLIEKPRDPQMGRFALPVFRFVKLLEDKPPEISAKVADETNRILAADGGKGLIQVVPVSGFLNAQIDFVSIAGEALHEVLTQQSAFGSSNLGADKTVLIEYSSPNIAKPFGVSHLRTTILGNSLRLIFRKLGYNVVGINYPGDWGTQFGKMIVAYRKWGGEEVLRGDVIDNLFSLYVKYHQEAEKDSSLDDEAREAFKSLEDGDPEAVALWEEFKRISYAEFDRVYSLLGIHFDLIIGESFFNDKMDALIERLEKAGLTEVSQGALIVKLDEPNLPPALLKKADGATLYITRDLAGAVYRWETYKFHESLYVVGAAQSDHFKQCFKVLELLEEVEQVPRHERMTGRMKHIDFGWVRFGQKAMATRSGNIILLEDVINKSVSLVESIIREKNPDIDDVAKTAHMVGVGAVIFSQLSVRRQKDVNFSWEEVLNFDGETGPYLQYTHARLCSLLRNYPREVTADVNCELLDREEERRVIEHLADFPEAIKDAATQYEPFVIVAYLLRLAASFNVVYQRKTSDGRIDKIISDDSELSAARIALVKAVQVVLNEGLGLLGMTAPQKM